MRCWRRSRLGIWWRSTYTEDTDDAQVNGHLIQVSSRIAGQVLKVDVEENQVVKAGDVIAELDPSDYQVAVENAQAALASAQANAAAASVNVPITSVNTGSNLKSADADVSGSQASVQQAEQQFKAAQARVAQAQANATKAQADLERYKPLVEKDVISKQQFDAAVAAADAAQAQVADAGASEQAASDGVRVARQREAAAQAQYKYAQTGPQQVAVQDARAKAARRRWSRPRLSSTRPSSTSAIPRLSRRRRASSPARAWRSIRTWLPGQNLLTLVSLEDLWVTANFKETQLRHMAAGQPVEIEVDATGKTYHGKVTQIGGATGSVLSLFPPENATGNYVKVVQRVPVRIDFTDLKNEDPNHLLRPGLSVEPKVRVKP